MHYVHRPPELSSFTQKYIPDEVNTPIVGETATL